MTTLLQRVYISKINLSIQALYFVLLTYTLSSLRLRVLCYFKAISASCVSRHAVSWPSDAYCLPGAHSGSLQKLLELLPGSHLSHSD